MIQETLVAFTTSLLLQFLPSADVPRALCMVEVIQYEASGEGLAGKRAVANVVMNRVERDYFPDTVCGVLKAPNAFSHRRKGLDLNDIDLNNPIDLKGYKETVKVAANAIRGTLDDNTGGADHFFNPRYVQPRWANKALAVRDINDHRFVKLYH